MTVFLLNLGINIIKLILLWTELNETLFGLMLAMTQTERVRDEKDIVGQKEKKSGFVYYL